MTKPPGGSPNQVPSLGVLLSLQKAPIKKNDYRILLILPLYLILLLIWWRFRHVIKAMTDVENILNDDEFC